MVRRRQGGNESVSQPTSEEALTQISSAATATATAVETATAAARCERGGGWRAEEREGRG